MKNPRRSLLIAHGALAVAAATWLLWPLSGKTPWREEIEPEDRFGRLLSLAGPNTKETLASAMGILDPGGVLTAVLETGAHGLSVLEGGKRLEIPWGTDLSPRLTSGVAESSSPDGGPLTGLRILLDPGHHGGAWAEVESRHFPAWAVPMEDDSPDFRVAVTAAEKVPAPEGATHRLGTIREGDLNWATVRLLENQLRDAGAEVHLTRGPPPNLAFPEGMTLGFDAEQEARIWLDAARHRDPSLKRWVRLMPTRIAHLALDRAVRARSKENLHELYNQWDLRRRAAMAAKLDVDLTLSIHYNYAGNREVNHVIVFMPGHKSAEELVTGSARHHALARLIDGDLPLTKELGRRIGRAMHQGLGMPRPPIFAPPPGITPLWQPIDEETRLFARNLAIVRRTAGPVLLLEGPFMNHPAEAARLLGREVEVDQNLYPARVRDYADAVAREVIESAPLLRERRERRAAFSRSVVGAAPDSGGDA